MNSEQRLNILLKKYVETDNEEFRRAKRLIAERAKIQDEIKKTMKKLGITEHKIDNPEMEAIIYYNVNQYQKVDVDILPDEIKAQYITYMEVWRETLRVLRRNSE